MNANTEYETPIICLAEEPWHVCDFIEESGSATFSEILVHMQTIANIEANEVAAILTSLCRMGTNKVHLVEDGTRFAANPGVRHSSWSTHLDGEHNETEGVRAFIKVKGSASFASIYECVQNGTYTDLVRWKVRPAKPLSTQGLVDLLNYLLNGEEIMIDPTGTGFTAKPSEREVAVSTQERELRTEQRQNHSGWISAEKPVLVNAAPISEDAFLLETARMIYTSYGSALTSGTAFDFAEASFDRAEVFMAEAKRRHLV